MRIDKSSYVKKEPWISGHGLEGRLGAELAKDLSDSEIERCLKNCVLSKFCIETTKEARNNGLTIDQVYDGSWKKMASAFYNHENEKMLYDNKSIADSERKLFVVGFNSLKNNKDATELDWMDFVDTHISREYTPDHYAALQERIRQQEIEVLGMSHPHSRYAPEIESRVYRDMHMSLSPESHYINDEIISILDEMEKSGFGVNMKGQIQARDKMNYLPGEMLLIGRVDLQSAEIGSVVKDNGDTVTLKSVNTERTVDKKHLYLSVNPGSEPSFSL